MRELVTRVEFWVAVVFAVLVKLRVLQSRKRLTWMEGVFSAIVAVLGAAVFTGVAAEWQGVSSEEGQFALAGLLALTGEQAARLMLDFMENVKLADIVKWLKAR